MLSTSVAGSRPGAFPAEFLAVIAPAVGTSKGQPYAGTTDSGNRSQRVQNLWSKLRHRIAKDYPDLPALSYNKLRKTSADLVKRVSDGETAGVFLAHGQTVASDSLSDVYTNRHFNRVFAALLIRRCCHR